MADQEAMKNVFSPEEMEKVNQAKDTLENIVKPKLTQLNPKKRKAAVKMGNKMFGFVEKTQDTGSRNPQYVPPFVKLDNSKQLFEVVKVLSGYFELMNSVRQMLGDTILNLEDQIMQDSLSIYDMVKAAAKKDQPGAKLLADELKKWFQKGTSEPPEPPNTKA